MSYIGGNHSWISPSENGRHSVTRAESQNFNRGRTTDSDVYRVGIYGWRKRCLYGFILALCVMIFINLAMTIWILKVVDFNLDGMGSLKITREGIRVGGESQFLKPVYLNTIQSLPGQSIRIDSHRNVYLNARNLNGNVTGRLIVGDQQVQAVCDRFEVFNLQKELLFYTDKDEVAVKVDNLRIIGEGGSSFEGSVQTEIIRPEPQSILRLESPTRNLKVEAGQDIEILSRAGEINMTSFLDTILQSTNGRVEINAKNIYMTGLSTAHAGAKESSSLENQHQLCLCKGGKLFLANAESDCRAEPSVCRN